MIGSDDECHSFLVNPLASATKRLKSTSASKSSVRDDFKDSEPHTAHPPSSNSLGEVALMKSLIILSDDCMVDGSGGNLFSPTCILWPS